MIGFIRKWRNRYIARMFIRDCTAVIRKMYPDDKFQIQIDKLDDKSVTFHMDTDSDEVMVCWILIQESLKCNLRKSEPADIVIEPNAT